ncbi:hypothetical protein LZ575_07390 [Antarcticibacterium sp. 1MA-6-2]|uniref:MATE family efflux transporter n=1 Tax=Antarcticibacterium sp. 1MA-6-2 TaxID=2908210 RepID=UPI001EFF33D7|nr:MATE family efflux transporter [Antarcticibacterium sp. 1MA-6-2]UJH92343.1 hypothetical protein LZ575_07390 [Antarcticibacterium sp. 1MA-6-2]
MKAKNKLRSSWELLKEALRGDEQDFTKIRIKTGIFLLSVPMILEMIMESLFAVVDIFFVGRLGEEAVATVGLTEAVIIIVYSVGVGISMAATAMVSRRFGEKKYTEAKQRCLSIITVWRNKFYNYWYSGVYLREGYIGAYGRE